MPIGIRVVGMVVGMLLWAHAARAEVVELKAGDVLKGKVVERSPEAIVLEHPVLGRTRIPMAAVASVQTDEEAVAKAAKAGASQPASQPAASVASATTTTKPGDDPEIVKAKAKAAAEAWKRQVEVGANGSRGDTQELSVYAAFKATQKDDEGKWAADLVYNRRETNDKTTREDFTAGILHDEYFGKSPWFFTAGARYDYNNFTNYQHRLQGSVGPGYRILHDEKFEWLVRSGIGARKEWASDRLTPQQLADFNNDVIPEANVGTQFTWKISKRQVFDTGTTFFFDLEDPTNNRVVSTADWQVKIDPEHNLSFKIGVANEYRSEVVRPAHYNNFKFFAALVYGF